MWHLKSSTKITKVQSKILYSKRTIPKIGVGLKSEHLKFVDSTNFFSYPYHTDPKNGFGCSELVNLNKSRPDTFLILFLPKPK